jgi:signal transduction histidine kinase/HAMP domain-containing protein
MNTPHQTNRRLGITFKIAFLSWLVTIVTLSIFVMVIVPDQKSTFEDNLQSKARGVAASLQDVIAGAAITGDLTTVVDSCKEVLKGDESIDSIVIAKNDGYSIVNESAGAGGVSTNAAARHEPSWYVNENMDGYWHPLARRIRGGILVVPELNRRVFHYSRPFDYSGIEWGWIHIGLSLKSYDHSVSKVYYRTGMLAILCIAFSLGASFLYARHLVHPIQNLQAVVTRVAGGDLSARAAIRSGDEVESLADSFNAMTATLLQRDRILESVRIAAQQFLTALDWRQVIDVVLAKIGQAADVSHVDVFENHSDPDGNPVASQRFEWVSDGTPPQIQNPRFQAIPYQGAGFEATANGLRNGQIVAGLVSQLGPAERALIENQGIQSLMLVPIFVELEWWGFLSLDDCRRERHWTDAERDSLRAAAGMLGASIARKRTQDALIEAKNTLEQRVAERTQELERQMLAKEKANAELAETQQRLIQISRMAGMAEVATGVLHNVGNVLNSVNVSCTLSIDCLKQSKLANLGKVVGMLDRCGSNLDEFLTQDPKGRQIPGYLASLAPVLMEEQALMLKELHSLREKIDHIKEIVAMQQSYAMVSGVTETLLVSQLVEDSLKLNHSALARHRIRVHRQFEELPPANLEKHKILQILLNLIRNAKHAMQDAEDRPRELTLRVFSPRPDRVAIQVIDTGVGIPAENLTRIFAHGFTTRKDGHGFGLHSGALAARELGGSLLAESPGPNLGATFTLELPFERHKPL